MVKVNIISSDLLFADMLCSEIGATKADLAVSVNRYEEGGIVVLDLDSDQSSADLSSDDRIIGFTRNEDVLPKSVLNKCYSVMHRPFLVDDLKRLVEKLALDKDVTAPMPPVADEIDPERLKFEKDSISLDGKRIGLSGNEYAVLQMLYENKSTPVSRESLNRVLSSCEGNICDVYICRLRSKLESGGSEKFIFTVRGKGYMLKI